MRTRAVRRFAVLTAVVVVTGAGWGEVGDAAGRFEVPRPGAAASCEDPLDPVELTSVEQVRSLLVGTWIRCAGPAFSGALVDDVGLEVTADGRFYRVFELADDSLARATGPGQEGDWEVIDTTDMNGPGSYQVNWTLSSGGLITSFPAFFDSPPTLRTESGATPAYYQRWTGAPPDQGQPPATVGDCPVLGAEIEPDSIESAIVGTWIRCAGAPPFLGATVDDIGIEVTADGRFHRLFRLPDGALARATGDRQEGTWEVVDRQIDWNMLGSGTEIAHPTFYAEPTMLRLVEAVLGETAYFERWTGDPPVTVTTTTVTTAPATTSTTIAQSAALPATGQDATTKLAAWAALTGLVGIALVVTTRARRRGQPDASA